MFEEYIATHYGLEDEQFFAAEYVVNEDGVIVAYKMDTCWRTPEHNGYETFPEVSSLYRVTHV
jgi:hypothetical protein